MWDAFILWLVAYWFVGVMVVVGGVSFYLAIYALNTGRRDFAGISPRSRLVLMGFSVVIVVAVVSMVVISLV